MSKKCLFCKYSIEDKNGVSCTINWDLLEYKKVKSQKVRKACKKAEETRDKHESKKNNS